MAQVRDSDCFLLGTCALLFLVHIVMLTREFKIKTNRTLKRMLDEHTWVLVGVYNWAIKQIENELKDCRRATGPQTVASMRLAILCDLGLLE